MEMEGRGQGKEERGEGYGGHGCLSVTSWTQRRPQRAGFYRVKENLGATVWTTEKNNKTEVKHMIVLAILVKLKSY